MQAIAWSQRFFPFYVGNISYNCRAIASMKGQNDIWLGMAGRVPRE